MRETLLRDDLFGDENADRDGQIETGTFFLDIGWCQVDGDFLGGKMKSRILQRRANPIAALTYCRIRQSHDRKLWKATGDIDFHVDHMGVEADERNALHFGKHGQSVAMYRAA